MSTNPRQELCESGGGSECGCSNNLVDVDAEMGTYEEAEVPENSCGREVTSLDMDVSLEPYVGKEFKSEHEAKAFYNGYARYMGFTIRKNSLYRSARDRAVTSRVFVCSKEGFRRQRSADKGDVKRRTKITRVGCKALLWVKKQPSGMWVVKQFHREHNHELTPMKVDLLRSPKNMLDNVKDYVETLKAAGIETSIIQRLFIEEAHRIGGMGDADTDIQSEEKKKIHELSLELKRERRRSATYREQLNVVLKEMENHAHHISTQVEDVVRSIKEVESQGSKTIPRCE